ncbi:MAG: sugar transferase [Deltaproteobacteria bacterium]|nr:sugar transferase [Deltaproteobacteria bacterium]
MLKQQARLFTKLAVAVDAACILAALPLAHALIQHFDGRLARFLTYDWILLIILPVWLYLITKFGLYSSLRTRSFPQLLWALIKVHLVGGIVISSAVYLVDPKGFSRLLLITYIIICLLLLSAAKGSIKLLLGHFRRRGYNIRQILIVGAGERLTNFVGIIRRHADWGLIIAGIVNFCGEDDGEQIPGCIDLGHVDDLIDICKRMPIDEVVFSVPPEKLAAMDDHIAALQEMGITVRMVIDLYDMPTSRKELALFHGDIPMLTFYSKAFDAEQLFLKRCLDIAGALVGLVITGVLLPFIALAIRLESRGPLFFGQKRVGESGRIFKCWKFRSMFVDAEERKQELMARNEIQGAMFKMRDDPRVTRVGRFIRKTSLDELPQFWNVLLGEMSLVGTRPPTPDEVATYENWHHKRICIKPGITGLWQVSGRSQIQDFDEVVRLDIRYIEEWSLWLDIKLLLKTVWVVFAGKGAR